MSVSRRLTSLEFSASLFCFHRLHSFIIVHIDGVNANGYASLIRFRLLRQ
jgi:hypothetical protein